MEMHVQQRSARFFDRAFERHLDDIGVIQMLRIPKIDNQMAAGVTEAVSFDKVVFGAGFPGKLTRLDRSICSGVVRLRLSIHTNLFGQESAAS